MGDQLVSFVAVGNYVVTAAGCCRACYLHCKLNLQELFDLKETNSLKSTAKLVWKNTKPFAHSKDRWCRYNRINVKSANSLNDVALSFILKTERRNAYRGLFELNSTHSHLQCYLNCVVLSYIFIIDSISPGLYVWGWIHTPTCPYRCCFPLGSWKRGC